MKRDLYKKETDALPFVIGFATGLVFAIMMACFVFVMVEVFM